MKITNDYLPNRFSFKKGLTREAVQTVKNMTEGDCIALASKIKQKYGVNTRLFEIPSMLYCVEKTIQIMKRAGFNIPGSVIATTLDNNVLGCYNDTLDTVFINNTCDEFYDLEKLDKAADESKVSHPRNGHFLFAYLHEFLHAAHYKNLCKNLGEKQGKEVYWGKLSEKKPSDVMIDPIRAFLDKMPTVLLDTGLLDKIIPPRFGYYAYTDLCEYFSEKVSSLLSEQLGDESLIKSVDPDFAKKLKSHPDEWTFSKALSEETAKRTTKENLASFSPPVSLYLMSRDVANVVKEHINYLDGDIYNGNIKGFDSEIFLR